MIKRFCSEIKSAIYASMGCCLLNFTPSWLLRKSCHNLFSAPVNSFRIRFASSYCIGVETEYLGAKAVPVPFSTCGEGLGLREEGLGMRYHSGILANGPCPSGPGL